MIIRDIGEHMHVSLQMPSRLRTLVELALVLGLAALIYGLGITTDNTAPISSSVNPSSLATPRYDSIHG